MTINRALRTSARQMLMSQFSAVDRPFTFAPSGAVIPTRSAIGATSRAIAAPVDQAEARASWDAQHDVLEDGHAGNERQFLVDEVHAEFGRPMWRVDGDRPPVNLDRAGVRLQSIRRGCG